MGGGVTLKKTIESISKLINLIPKQHHGVQTFERHYLRAQNKNNYLYDARFLVSDLHFFGIFLYNTIILGYDLLFLKKLSYEFVNHFSTCSFVMCQKVCLVSSKIRLNRIIIMHVGY